MVTFFYQEMKEMKGMNSRRREGKQLRIKNYKLRGGGIRGGVWEGIYISNPRIARIIQ
jgi:hypothetical protein